MNIDFSFSFCDIKSVSVKLRLRTLVKSLNVPSEFIQAVALNFTTLFQFLFLLAQHCQQRNLIVICALSSLA